MGAAQVESVYCDFTKLPTDSGKSYVTDGSLKICLKNYLNGKIDEWNYAAAKLFFRLSDLDRICRRQIIARLLLRSEKCRFQRNKYADYI